MMKYIIYTERERLNNNNIKNVLLLYIYMDKSSLLRKRSALFN